MILDLFTSEIKGAVQSAVKAAFPEAVFPEAGEVALAAFERPKNEQFGEVALPCFQLAKSLRKAPPQIAQALAEKLSAALPSGVGAVNADGGYLNFKLVLPDVALKLAESFRSGALFKNRPATNKRVVVEYSQPNTHKAFHVGHTRCASLGDSIRRLKEWRGDTVIPVNYIGDEGTHVAICLWMLEREKVTTFPEQNRGEFLGLKYAQGVALLALDSYTAAPVKGVVIGRITTTAAHPKRAELTVCTIDIGNRTVQVATGQRDIAVGQLVPVALPGADIPDRQIKDGEVAGVKSEGMLCNGLEIGLLDKPIMPEIPETMKLGTEVAEAYRLASVPTSITSVLEHTAQLKREVSGMLKRIEAAAPDVKELLAKTREMSLSEFHEVYDWLNCRFDHYFFESEVAEPGKELVRKGLESGVFSESNGAIGIDLSKEKLGYCVVLKSDGTALYSTRDLALAYKKREMYNLDESLYVVDVAQSLHFMQVFRCLELLGFDQAKQCRHIAYGQVVLPDGKMSSRKGNVILLSQLRAGLEARISEQFLSRYEPGTLSEKERSDIIRGVSLAIVRYGMLQQNSDSNVVFDLEKWCSQTGNTGAYILYALTRVKSILRGVPSTSTRVDFSKLHQPAEEVLIRTLLNFEPMMMLAAEQLAPHYVCSYVYELAKLSNRFYEECPIKSCEDLEVKEARLALMQVVEGTIQKCLDLIGVPPLAKM